MGLSGCTFAFENNRGVTTQAHTTFHLFVGFDIAALAVGAFVWGLIFWCALSYRRKHPGHFPKQTREHRGMEIAYTITPLIIVVGLFAVTIVSENKVDKVIPKPQVKLNVTAFQWGWKFDYPTAGRTAEVVTDPDHFGTIELPVGETTQIRLVSADVVHSFLVSEFNFSRYAQPGVTNYFDITPTQTGTFIGRCDFFCGLHHDLMVFHVKVVSQQQYQQWVQSTAGAVA